MEKLGPVRAQSSAMSEVDRRTRQGAMTYEEVELYTTQTYVEPLHNSFLPCEPGNSIRFDPRLRQPSLVNPLTPSLRPRRRMWVIRQREEHYRRAGDTYRCLNNEQSLLAAQAGGAFHTVEDAVCEAGDGLREDEGGVENRSADAELFPGVPA